MDELHVVLSLLHFVQGIQTKLGPDSPEEHFTSAGDVPNRPKATPRKEPDLRRSP